MRVKIYFRKCAGDPPKLLSPMDTDEDTSLSTLRKRLEDLNVFKRIGPFELWDAEECCRIDVDFESLNSVRDCVHLIPAEEDSEGTSLKRPRVVSVGESVGMHDGIPDSFEFGPEGGEPECTELPPTNPVSTDRAATSEDNSPTDGANLKSVLLSKEVLQWYTRAEEKLRAYLKVQAQEDHAWSLTSWDQDGAAVVKIYCHECRAPIGGSTGKHNKSTVSNLFSNFRKSHMVSTGHIRNYCRQKGVQYENHPQRGSTRSSPVEVTTADHKRLIEEGIGILDAVNESIHSIKPTFQLLGDPNDPIMKSYWFKAKCLICPREVFQLCPPKRNLEANLMNHLHGVVHTKSLEDLQRHEVGSALSTGKRGRPCRGSASSTQSSQTGLHSFFKHCEGEIQNYDKTSICARTCWGFRGPHCVYAGKTYAIESLFSDPHPGKVWYPEPHLEAAFTVDNHVVVVEGAFRHRSCRRFSTSLQPFLNFTCSMCDSIVGESDFRSRVVREEHAIEKRGCRGTAGGRRVGYLSALELSAHSRVLSKKFRQEQRRHWAAKTTVAQLKVSRPTLKESARRASEQHNVYKFCNDIIVAHRTGAMGGKAALWDFLRDVASNLNRKKKGTRWSPNSVAFTQAMKMYGERRMCELFSLNFAGPSFSTTKRENKKGVQFVHGEHPEIFRTVADIYEQAKEAHGIVGPVPVILAEDETKVKGKVAWDHRQDTLVGFCGPKEDHVCISDYKVLVGSGDFGYNRIVDGFRTNRVGAFARIIMVNPLHCSLPRLVLAVTCTCNCFDASWVRQQWQRIDDMWNKECLSKVGPVIGHASDGDSRRRQLMLADYRSLGGLRLNIDWEGWLLSASADEYGGCSGLHDQDWIHNGKKLINPLDSPVKTLQLGEDGAFHTHLGMIYNKYSFDEHGLKLEDVQRKDRQNWASAQRICQRKTQRCLAEMRNSPEAQRERTLGTEMYLSICGDYIDIFGSMTLTLRSRIVLAAKVSFFFRLWKLWFTHGNHAIGNNSVRFKQSENFVSQQCFLDVQLSCHFVVLLVKHFRDRYPHMPVPLHLSGSDSCEIFFSKIGGMTGMERSYDFHDLVNTANTLNRLSAVEYGDNGLKFGRVHNKVENIWNLLHPLREGEIVANLGDYSSIATDSEIVTALKEGFKEAQAMLRILNMAPSTQATVAKKLWFVSPWKLEKEDPSHLAYQPLQTPVPGVDGDAECERARMQSCRELDIDAGSNSNPNFVLEDDLETDDPTALPALQEEARQVVVELISEAQPQITSGTTSSKVLPVVTYQGHSIYKSTLVSELNGNPYLSKDRLTRMKNSVYFNNSDDYLAASSSTTSMLLGLGSDVGVYFKDMRGTASTVKAAQKRIRKRTVTKGTNTTTEKKTTTARGGNTGTIGRPSAVNAGVPNGMFYIGRVQKMRVKVGSKWGICRQALDLMQRDVQNGSKATVSPTAMVYLHWFKKHPGHHKYRYVESDCVWIDVDAIISTVSLDYSPSTKIYTLDEVDANSLAEFVSNQK